MTNAAEMAELASPGLDAVELDMSTDDRSPAADGRTSEQVRILDALSRRSPRPVADIARRAGLSVATVVSVLGLFGLEGVVRESGGGWLLSGGR